MKKRLLATFVAVAVLVSMFSCLIASADINEEKNVFFKDFEDGTDLGVYTFRDVDSEECPTVSYETEIGPEGSDSTVLHISEPSPVQDVTEDQWQYVRFVPLVTHLDLTKKYTVSMYVKGDISNLQIIGHTGVLHQYPQGELLGTEWSKITCTVGPTSYLGFQVIIQSKEEKNGRNVWIDDISIDESDTDSSTSLPDIENQNTPILDYVTPIFQEDFEGEGVNNPQVKSSNLSVVQDLFDTKNHAIKVTNEVASEVFTTNTFINNADPDKTYTFVFRTLGDCGMIAIGKYLFPDWAALPPNNMQNPENGFTGWSVTSPTWRWHVIKTTGQKAYSFFGQVQGDGALLGYQLYIDDIYVYADDYFTEAKNKLNGIPTTPRPTLSTTAAPTVEPTTEPSSTPSLEPTNAASTIAPTIEPSSTPVLEPTNATPTIAPTTEPSTTPTLEPNKPGKPAKSDKNDKTSKDKNSNSDKKYENPPKTGDNSSLILWIVFALISLSGIVAASTIACRRKAVRK